MKAAGVTEDMAKGANMIVIFGWSIVFAFLIAFSMEPMVVQQFQTYAMLSTQPDSGDPNSESSMMLKRFMELYGNSYRTFGHGAFHGILLGIGMALPIIGTNALFERKGAKYIFINAGYWTLSMALMGGVLCAFS